MFQTVWTSRMLSLNQNSNLQTRQSLIWGSRYWTYNFKRIMQYNNHHKQPSMNISTLQNHLSIHCKPTTIAIIKIICWVLLRKKVCRLLQSKCKWRKEDLPVITWVRLISPSQDKLISRTNVVNLKITYSMLKIS